MMTLASRVKKFGKIIIIAGPIIYLFSCVHDPFPLPEDSNQISLDTLAFMINTKTCNPDTVYFESQILPIYISNCTVVGCHDAKWGLDGVILTSYSGIMKGIKPFDPLNSEYYKVLVSTHQGDQMPRIPGTETSAPLSSEQTNLIQTWILQGAEDTFCDGCDTTDYTYTYRIQPIIENNCAASIGCHAAGSINGELTSYENIKQRVDLDLIQKRVLIDKDMPPSHPLTDCERLKIKLWIDHGAANN